MDHGFPDRFAARIDIKTAQGLISAEIPQVRGAPDRPVDASDIISKFTANAGRRYDPDRVQRLKDVILDIETMSDMGVVADLLG